ncbi:MAG: hypothetical protein M1153_01795 [Patescibacteria group bacterium]|nr:hypothetical protein [Patescibacteria group bacterium]
MNTDTSIKKRSLGQFFTRNDFWIKEHILNFIRTSGTTIAYDPFAGSGDLLKVAREMGFEKYEGLDVDSSLGWGFNDSLLNVPKISGSIIITNPPYLTNYSAKRRGIYSAVEKYFSTCDYDDLYQLAIEKCLQNDFGIIIVPETFINSGFPKNRLVSITIIEDQLFLDTENPVCVICFDNKIKPYGKIKVYKGNEFIGYLDYFEKLRRIPRRNRYIKFNSLEGQIALRAVDTTNPYKPILFMKPSEIDYDLRGIKHSSRLITLIEIGADFDLIDKIIEYSNNLLFDFRKKTRDVLLSPFKGNKKNGERRRRLDYMTARAILEDAYDLASNSAKTNLL